MITMTKRNYDTYDAFFTFELLKDALSNRGNSGEKIVTTLEAIEEDMRIASKSPSAVAAKPVTSSTSSTIMKLRNTDRAISRARSTN